MDVNRMVELLIVGACVAWQEDMERYQKGWPAQHGYRPGQLELIESYFELTDRVITQAGFEPSDWPDFVPNCHVSFEDSQRDLVKSDWN